MDSDYLASLFNKVREIVGAEGESRSAWREALQLPGLQDDQILSCIDVQSAGLDLAARIARVLEVEPPPAALTYFYFGLIEKVDGSAGLYISGGTAIDPVAALADGEQPYFPDQRFLECPALAEALKSREVSHKEGILFDYYITVALASVLAVSAIRILGIKTPIFVGFDSGDFDRMAN